MILTAPLRGAVLDGPMGCEELLLGPALVLLLAGGVVGEVPLPPGVVTEALALDVPPTLTVCSAAPPLEMNTEVTLCPPCAQAFSNSVTR